jgi:hypothetical protein
VQICGKICLFERHIVKSCHGSKGKAPVFKIRPYYPQHSAYSRRWRFQLVRTWWSREKSWPNRKWKISFGTCTCNRSYNSGYLSLKRCVFAPTESFLVIIKLFSTQMSFTRLRFNSFVCSWRIWRNSFFKAERYVIEQKMKINLKSSVKIVTLFKTLIYIIHLLFNDVNLHV